MIVKYIKSKEIISRVIRNTRLKDPTYLNDIPSWIAEAIGVLKTHYQLKLVAEKVEINYGIGNLPCGMDMLASVIYKNERVLPSQSDGPLYMAGGHADRNHYHGNVFPTLFNSPISKEHYNPEAISGWKEFMVMYDMIGNCKPSPSVRYRINFNKIEVGIQKGHIVVFYWKLPLDDEGFPYIPDQEEYKQALYWYVRMMLVGTGYQDPVFNFDYLNSMWEMWAARAMNRASSATIDEVRESMITNNRLVPDNYDWESFYHSEEEGPIYI